MSTVPSKSAVEAATGGPALSLAGLLNILFQGRRIILAVTLVGLAAGLVYSFVTKPLYLATAQVRPGIVAYSPAGGPVREWALKDIVRWFRTRLYWQDMRPQEMFKDFEGAPDIMAEFIPSGPQYMQGGDVITLKNLATRPEVAVATLDQAIISFNKQASLDSLGSTMYLTIGGARVRMAKISQDMKQLEANKERTELTIAQEERNLAQVEVQDQKLAKELSRLEGENAWRRRTAKAATAQAASIRGRLAEAQGLLQALVQSESGGSLDFNPGGDVDETSAALLRVLGREQAGQVGELLVTVNALERTAFAREVTADSLQTRIASTELDIELLKLEREVTLVKAKQDIQQKINEYRIQLNRDIPHKKAQLQNDLDAERVQLELLSPLERIGSISVSEKPVRPRKLRATAILTVLGFLGSLFLVLCLEYYRNNQAAITAARRG